MIDLVKTSPIEAYRQRVLSGQLQPDSAQAAVAEQLQKLYEQLLSSPSSSNKWLKLFRRSSLLAPVNLYIWGDVGRGKSMLMDLLVECLPADYPKRRMHYHAFMADIHHRLHQYRLEYDHSADALKPIATYYSREFRLLCLDEFQVQDIADAMILARLFTLLLDAGLTVITTSNRIPDDLYKNGLQRQYFLQFIELVKHRFKVIELESPQDYRLKKLQGHPTYFMPGSNISELTSLFTSLSNQPATCAVLTVNERNITLPVTASGMVWCHFDELCRTALGAEDYAALAAEYHTVFLLGIPRLSREDRNEAKRFVTLIDTLYEHRVRLLCSADAFPEQLYPVGDGNFEFQRTVSRLHEMQSEEYLRTSHLV